MLIATPTEAEMTKLNTMFERSALRMMWPYNHTHDNTDISEELQGGVPWHGSTHRRVATLPHGHQERPQRDEGGIDAAHPHIEQEQEEVLNTCHTSRVTTP